MELTVKNAEKLVSLVEEICKLENLKENLKDANGIRFYKNKGDAYSPFLELETNSNLRSLFRAAVNLEIGRLEDEKNKLLN